MSRLVDYFVVVGYDHEKEKAGKILQRFPEHDWPETPFHQGIEMFCQPQGWRLHHSPRIPEFFVSVLTDVDAYRHYCACLTFTEAYAPSASETDDEEDDESHDTDTPQTLYAPKSICVISRHECFETFRQCLGIIYAVYLDRLQYKIEVLVGNLIGSIQVPPSGGAQTRFSIGADDWQYIQPPQTDTLPISRSCVASFCHELGVNNVILLLSAALADSKILFYSCSYSRLTNASHALTSICYPLKYSYVYVPVLPAPLLEVLNSPTPFIMGIHASLKEQVTDLLDVIFVDLDGCQVEIPESVTVSLPPELVYCRTVETLKRVLDPSLLTCDHAFPSSTPSSSSSSSSSSTPRILPEMQDKEIRAVFIRFFCEVFAGYRTCLTVVRVHPEPVITFQKAQFLGQRNLVGDEFVSKVISSMSFGRFVQEYASPFRQQTVFDEVYSSYSFPQSTSWESPERAGADQISTLIDQIANRLYLNENPTTQAFALKCLRPSNVSSVLPPGNPFPFLDAKTVESVIQDGISKQFLVNKQLGLRIPSNNVIPLGTAAVASTGFNEPMNGARRLEALVTCVNHIFEKRINEAKKLLPAVIRVLANPNARLALAKELASRVQSNRAMLEHEQFEMVVKLINCALQDDSVLDEHGVAAAFLPLATAFCRKLCTGVIQFAYTKIQEHEIWANISFWESAFYKDVQQHITALYWPDLLTSHNSPIAASQTTERRQSLNEISAFSNSLTAPTALDIAANQLRTFLSIPPEEQKELIDREESTVFSQAIHYANRIVYLRVPLDASSTNLRRRNSINADTNSNSNFTPSYQESDRGSLSEESGFQEEEKAIRDVPGGVVKFVTKFVDKVCGESQVREEHIKQLHQMIPGVVAMHVESLEAVYRESRGLQPILKSKPTRPTLMRGEDLVIDGMRGYLLQDGREEMTSFFPCEGALYLTTYRVIFMGTPVDQYVSDNVVSRGFPVAALFKEKPLSGHYLTQLDQFSPEGLQLRSATFQLMKIAFDEEVTRDMIDHFRKFLERIRYPLHTSEILHQNISSQNAALTVGKNGKKVATIKGFAKKTLLRTAKAAGLKTKSMNKRDSKTFNPSSTPLPERKMHLTLQQDRHGLALDEEGSEEDSDTLGGNYSAREPQSFERVIDRAYVVEYRRIGLIPSLSNISKRMDEYRLCQLNLHYKMCPSYPALFIVPNQCSDDGVRNLARHFKNSRLPAVVWQHPRTRAVLLRSASYQHTRMSSVFKNSSMSTAGSMMSIPVSSHHEGPTAASSNSSQADFDKFVSALIHSIPVPGSMTRRPSLGSVLNLNHYSLASGTPEAVRRNSITPWNRAVQTLKSGSVAVKGGGKRTSILFSSDKSGSLLYNNPSELSVFSGSSSDTASVAPSVGNGNGNGAPALYILTDKANIKSLRHDSYRSEVVAVEYPDIRRIKTAFKKLLQTMAPSAKEAGTGAGGAQGAQTATGWHRQMESLDWLKQVQKIVKLAGAVVDLIDAQGSSVMLCLEEGWDATCQISALSQLLMDPYYRKIEGFGILVEKEFLSFGHRFAHRNNLTQSSQTSGIAPVFLQFLDCVAQIQRQFPMSFEFNAFYLKFLAYHSTSSRFTNFITDCEAERSELGLENPRYSVGKEDPSLSSWPLFWGSIWDYIETTNHKSGKFHNFLYANTASAEEEDAVLRPFSDWHNMCLWEYYLDESLAFGSLYDLESVNPSIGLGDGSDVAMEMGKYRGSKEKRGQRRMIVNGYTTPFHVLTNAFNGLFEEIGQLRKDLGYDEEEGEKGGGDGGWVDQWQQIDQDAQLIVPAHKATALYGSYMVRSHSRKLQNETTKAILDRSRVGGDGSSNKEMGHPHRFVRQTYTNPTHCHFCSQVLWGNGKMAVVCADCGYHAHDKCAEQVANTCVKVKAEVLSAATEETLSRHIMVGRDTLRDASPATPVKGGSRYGETAAGTGNGNWSSESSRILEGYLFKRGAMLKGWKLKWFVLDSMQHQLRYYESNQDRQVRGIIDLSEVTSVGPCNTNIILQGAPKRMNDKACFDIRTMKRTYNLCAKDPQAAQEWTDKIQVYIQ